MTSASRGQDVALAVRPRTVRVAVLQAAPDLLNLEGTLERLAAWSSKAAAEGVQLLALPEAWIPGYPIWLDVSPDAALWNHAGAKEVFARLWAQAIDVPGPACARIAEIARESKMELAAGIVERVGRSLYNAMVLFGSDGTLLNHHRKLMPTYSERLVFRLGDADGLRAVETPVGRVGALICWEHWMPLARHALHTTGEDIHIALWSAVHGMHSVVSRQYAFEGRCFVLAVGAIQPTAELPAELRIPPAAEGGPGPLALTGGSAIIGPDGEYLTEPVFGEERLVVADLDFAALARESLTLDVAGHYSRPDLFEVKIHRNSRGHAAAGQGDGQIPSTNSTSDEAVA